MVERVVIDTSVLVAALIGSTGPNREVLRRCLQREVVPLLGNALFAEYEDVVSRESVREKCPLSGIETETLIEAICSVSEWVPVYFLLRPNLKDEADNHVVELALAGNAKWLVTNNLKDFTRSELVIPELQIVSPEQWLQEH